MTAENEKAADALQGIDRYMSEIPIITKRNERSMSTSTVTEAPTLREKQSAAAVLAERHVLTALAQSDRERTQLARAYADAAERAGQIVFRIIKFDFPATATVGGIVRLVCTSRSPLTYEAYTLPLTELEIEGLRNVGEPAGTDMGLWRYFGLVDGAHVVVEVAKVVIR
jgi:hypothetical protein